MVEGRACPALRGMRYFFHSAQKIIQILVDFFCMTLYNIYYTYIKGALRPWKTKTCPPCPPSSWRRARPAEWDLINSASVCRMAAPCWRQVAPPWLRTRLSPSWCWSAAATAPPARQSPPPAPSPVPLCRAGPPAPTACATAWPPPPGNWSPSMTPPAPLSAPRSSPQR